MEAMLKSGAVTRRFGVTVKTLERWDLFAPLTRSPTGLRLYSESPTTAASSIQH